MRNCRLVVTHPGFEVHETRLGIEAHRLLVRLRLAVVKETVEAVQDQRTEALSRTSLSSISLSEVELRTISNDTAQLVQYAKLLAGRGGGPDVVYVDGLPSSNLPPAEMVARISVNPDPFSAEYSDGDQTHIDIMTKGNDRSLRFNLGGAPLRAGGRDVLARGLQSKSRSGSWGLRGPVPRLPLTFSARASIASSVADVPITAVLPSDAAEHSVVPIRAASVANRSVSGFVNGYYARAELLRAHLSISTAASKGLNLGAGGLTLPEAASSASFSTREVRATMTRTGNRFLYRGGLVFAEANSSLHANSPGMGVTVIGSFQAGGAPITRSESNRSNWTWKNVFQTSSSRRFWTAGTTISGVTDHSQEMLNQQGTVTFENFQGYAEALAGRATGTWFLTRGAGGSRYSSTTTAPFFHGEVLRFRNLVVMGGLRGDSQSTNGMLLSPRLSFASEYKNFVLRAGGGVFVHPWSNNVFMKVRRGDLVHFQEFVVPNASFRDTLDARLDGLSEVRTHLVAGLTRWRDAMAKVSMERPVGKLVPGIEYTRTESRHRLGSRRLEEGNGWLDVIESNRNARSHRLHARMSSTWRSHMVVAHYEWVRVWDDGDGPFSFPARADDLRTEWARSNGISPHTFTLVGSFRLPRKISLTTTASVRSSAPFNIITGLDEGNGLHNDRGGRARNSGNGPGYRSLSFYGHRRIALPSFWSKSRHEIYLNLAVQGDNLLGSKNYTGVNSVIGSPNFGRPLAAMPGRSIQLWLSFD